jgi:hypothetical protein
MAAARRFAAAFAAATVAAVTAGLLARLALRRAADAPPPQSAAPPVASPTPATPISPAWKVAFEDKQGGVSVMNADGSGLRQVLDAATQPAWSPDRKRLAFARRGNVWVADADGAHPTQLTFWPDTADYAVRGIAWDGAHGRISFGRTETFALTRVAASGARKDEGAFRTATLYHVRVPAPGTAVTRSADPFFPFAAPSAPAEQTPPRFDWTDCRTGFEFSKTIAPAWSADGERLFFARNGDLWLAEYVGATEPGLWNVTRVSAAARYDGATLGGSRWTAVVESADCSPDGAAVAYDVVRQGGSGIEELHVLRYGPRPDKDGDGEPDGTGVLSDVQLPVYGRHPRFSPNGKWILFVGNANHAGYGLYAATPDGRHVDRVPAPDGAENPVW